MAFESGAASFRVLYVPKAMPGDAVVRFATHAAPPLDTLGNGEINGWVTGRHLLDRNITDRTAFFAGHLRLCLMQAVRKIPEALLRAECRMEELAQLEASGAEALSATARSEIRKSITDRLLPEMPPTLKGVPFVHDAGEHLVYAAALSDKQLDAFQIHVVQTLGFGFIPATPEAAAVKRSRVNPREWAPASFAPDLDDASCEAPIGRDFLTWLWFVAEARGGMVNLGKAGSFGVMVEGPLLFILEGQGAHEAVLRKGEPLMSAEAKTALLGGKKLRRAKVTLARNEESWRVAVDADAFVFRGLKLPETEKLDPIGRFQDRIAKIGVFVEAWYSLFDRFVAERTSESNWKATQKEIHAWVKGRKTRF
jgi:hypothetical protein